MISMEDCAIDGGKEFLTEMHCARIIDLGRFYRN